MAEAFWTVVEWENGTWAFVECGSIWERAIVLESIIECYDSRECS